MRQISRTIKAIIEDRLGEVHTALPAKIKSYDAETMYAEVILLNKKQLGDEQVQIPPVVEVPVAHFNAGKFIIRPPYKKDDIVQVVFNEHALDKLLISGKSEEVKLTRRFSYDDAVVITGLKLESEDNLNSSFTSDLLIENRDTSSRLVMKENGDLLIETSGKTEINTTGTTDIISGSTTTVTAPTIIADGEVHLGGSGGEGLSFGETLKSWLDGHTHPGDSGGTTGAPNSPSPPPSSKVFTN